MPAETVWTDHNLANPHIEADKGARVQKMFAAIAGSYDLNNRLHSLYIDQYWRKKTVKLAAPKPLDTVVDVACGTGDLAIRFYNTLSNLQRLAFPREELDPSVIGIDFTYAMLPLARAKQQFPKGFRPVQYITGDAQSLPLPDACADILSIAFGIRNVQDVPTALREFRRVLRPGGRCMILEFSVPTNPLVRWAYNLYCSKIMPWTATWISRDKSGAYKYLPHSVATFLTKDAMIAKLTEAGFTTIEAFPLTFGAVVVYRAS